MEAKNTPEVASGSSKDGVADMCSVFQGAPKDFRSNLLHEMESSPGLHIYEYCHRVEAGFETSRKDFHRLLAWIDRHCLKCPTCVAAACG